MEFYWILSGHLRLWAILILRAGLANSHVLGNQIIPAN